MSLLNRFVSVSMSQINIFSSFSFSTIFRVLKESRREDLRVNRGEGSSRPLMNSEPESIIPAALAFQKSFSLSMLSTSEILSSIPEMLLSRSLMLMAKSS